MGAQDPRHLGRGAVRLFAFERGGQIQHIRRRARGDLPRRGLQGGEPTPAPGPDPPVEGLARDPNLVTEWSPVHGCGQGSDQPSPGTRRQARIGRVTDELVAPVRHLLRLFPPPRLFKGGRHVISSISTVDIADHRGLRIT